MEDKEMLSNYEDLFDAVLKVAFKDAMTREIDKMPSLEALKEMHPVSAELDQRVHRTIWKRKRIKKALNMMRSWPKATTFVCALVMLLTGALAGIAAYRHWMKQAVDRYKGSSFKNIGRGCLGQAADDTIP